MKSRGYFDGLDVNSTEYKVRLGRKCNRKERYQKAVSKFMERTKQSSPETPSVNPTAEKLKEEGNAFFRDGNYAQAYESYSKALNVDPNNPNNYMYYCNRATASYYLKHYDESVAGIGFLSLPPRL